MFALRLGSGRGIPAAFLRRSGAGIRWGRRIAAAGMHRRGSAVAGVSSQFHSREEAFISGHQYIRYGYIGPTLGFSQWANCFSHQADGSAFSHLLPPHGVVQTFSIDQFVVAAVLDDLAALEDVDSVGVQDRGETVRD